MFGLIFSLTGCTLTDEQNLTRLKGVTWEIVKANIDKDENIIIGTNNRSNGMLDLLYSITKINYLKLLYNELIKNLYIFNIILKWIFII